MDVRVLSQDKEQGKLSFVIKGADTAFANLLRRYIIEKVPTMAIQTIEFKENSGALYDEVVAHRLGLIPLSTDLKSYEIISECKCEGKGCNRCTLKLTLQASGPSTVLASQIKSKDPKVKPVQPEMPITKLLKDQEMELVATAILGRGEQHAKFSPGTASYKFKPEIIVAKQVKNAEEFVKNCPVKGLFELKGKNVTVNQDDIFKAELVEDYIQQADPSDAIKIIDTEDIVFDVEGWGQLSCKEMVGEAMNQYAQDLDKFEALLKKI